MEVSSLHNDRRGRGSIVHLREAEGRAANFAPEVLADARDPAAHPVPSWTSYKVIVCDIEWRSREARRCYFRRWFPKTPLSLSLSLSHSFKSRSHRETRSISRRARKCRRSQERTLLAAVIYGHEHDARRRATRRAHKRTRKFVHAPRINVERRDDQARARSSGRPHFATRRDRRDRKNVAAIAE